MSPSDAKGGLDSSLVTTVLFDLDGTLVHTSPDIAAALNATLAAYGRAVSLDATERMIGDGLRALFRKALAATALALQPAEADVACAAFIARYRASPAALSTAHVWVVDAVADLHARGTRLAICTNKAEDIAYAILDQLGLSRWFRAVVGNIDGRPKKPSAEPLNLCIARAGGDRRRTVLVGDSRSDVEAARAAGVSVILVPHGYGPNAVASLGGDRIAGDTCALLEAVQELLR